MVQLFLQEPTNGSANMHAVKERLFFLQKVEAIIKSVVRSGGRYEARLWLCNTISCIHSLDRHDQCDLFVDLLEMKFSRRDVASCLLRMILEKKPEKAGQILARKCYMLEKFFEGNPKRIMKWFDHFAVSGESTHKKGARALSQFVFLNRDTFWEELEWKGKHGQSPAVVATKPHYFHDLDVVRTIENFLEYVPDFWSSKELAESIKDGEILRIDIDYFVDQFLRLMYEENSNDVWQVVEDFLMEEQFSSLSKHLLVHLDEWRLPHFLKALGKLIRPNSQCKELMFPSCWLEVLLSKQGGSISLDDLLLTNCVIANGRQLLRLMNDEEQDEERNRMEELLGNTIELTDADHSALMKALADMKQLDAIKCIGIQSWLLFYKLSKECKSSESCESVFFDNKIEFRKADDYSLVEYDGHSSRNPLDTDDEDVTRSSLKRRKKRRKRYDSDEELLEFESSKGWRGTQSRDSRSWFLSTDGFSYAWNRADIPEHLSKHYFRTWLKRGFK